MVNFLTIIKDQPGSKKSIPCRFVNVRKFFGVATITVYSDPSSVLLLAFKKINLELKELKKQF